MADSLFFPFIPCLGTILCALALTGIAAGIWRVQQWRNKYRGTAYGGHGHHGAFSIVQPRNLPIYLMGHASALGIPLVLLLAWVVILVWPPP